MILERGVLALCLVGCGRVGFDDVGSAHVDAESSSAFACNFGSTAPPSVQITGRAFHYTGFNNQTMPVPMPSVFVKGPAGSAGSTTGDVDGKYALSFPTSNVPVLLTLEYSEPSFMTSVVIPDAPLDHDTRVDSMLWSIGDGPMWSAGAMGTVYNAVSLTREFGQGTINIAVADCAGNPIEGATVIVDPPPPIGVVYLAMDGLPTAILTSTVAPFSYGISFNAPPGPTTISAAKQGYVFAQQTIDVRADVNTIAIVRPRE